MRKAPLPLDVVRSATKRFDASQTFSPNAQQVIFNAQELARAKSSANVESVHLLLAALQLEPPDAKLDALLQISGLKADEVLLYARAAQVPGSPQEFHQLGKGARAAMRLAGKEARRSGCAAVDVSHLFVACFDARSSPELAEVLAPLSVSAEQLSSHLRGLARGEAAQAVQNESPLAQLSAHGERALEVAHATMRANFCGRVSTLHLLIGILENPDGDATEILQTLAVDVDELRRQARASLTSDGETAGPTRRFTPAAKRALDRAKAAAREGNRSHIGDADLLMGLLPQPVLWIERAQFGARPDDPAAAVLRAVDADLLRAILNGQQEEVPNSITPEIASQAQDLRWKMFVIFFCFQLIVISSTHVVTFAKRNATEFTMLMLAALIGSAFVACGMLVFSKDATRKANWQWSFAGAVAGMLVGITISNGLR